MPELYDMSKTDYLRQILTRCIEAHANLGPSTIHIESFVKIYGSVPESLPIYEEKTTTDLVMNDRDHFVKTIVPTMSYPLQVYLNGTMGVLYRPDRNEWIKTTQSRLQLERGMPFSVLATLRGETDHEGFLFGFDVIEKALVKSATVKGHSFFIISWAVNDLPEYVKSPPPVSCEIALGYDDYLIRSLTVTAQDISRLTTATYARRENPFTPEAFAFTPPLGATEVSSLGSEGYYPPQWGEFRVIE